MLARFSTLALPPAVRRSKPIRVVKAMMANVPVPGPKIPSYRPMPRPMARASAAFFRVHRAVVPVLVRQLPPPEDEHRRDGQDDEHHGLKRLIAEQQHDVGAEGAARKAAHRRQEADLDVHGPAAEKKFTVAKVVPHAALNLLVP